MGRWMTMLAAGVLGWATLAGGAAAAIDGPRTIVVAQDGSGDATTVAAGVAMAHEGDTVLVRPGTYVERVAVEANLEIRGDGRRETVVIQAPDDPSHHNDGSPVSVAVTFRGAFGTLSNLTVVGQARGRAISLEDGAAPTISNVIIDAAADWTGENVAVWWSGGANGILRDSTVSGLLVMSGAGTAPVIEWNRLWEACIVVRSDGTSRDDQPRPVLRQNTIVGCPMAVAVRIEAGSPVVEDNDLMIDGGTGLSLAGSGGIIRRNTIHDSVAGITIANPHGPVLLQQNLVRDNAVGIGVFDGDATVRMEGNQIAENGVALNLAGRTILTVRDDTVCGNGMDVRLVSTGGATPSVDGEVGECAQAMRR